MTREERQTLFCDLYYEIKKDPDKSKIISANALLGYDDGEQYTPTEYKRALYLLEEEKATAGDTESGLVEKAILWCKERLKKSQ